MDHIATPESVSDADINADEMDWESCNMFPDVDPVILNEELDFVDEAIILLDLARKTKNFSKPKWKSYLHDLTDSEKKHLILYNWIATSIVREKAADVAAVAAYVFNDARGTQVYYSKNSITTEDELHVQQFAQMIQAAAKNPISLQEFQAQYFDLMYRNCGPKLLRRLGELKDVLNFKEKSIKMTETTTYSPGKSYQDQLQRLLENMIKIKSPTTRSKANADLEALKLASSDDVFVALLSVFKSLISYSKSPPSAEMFKNLSGQCWIIGRSEILKQLSQTNYFVNAITNVARKLGDYYRGTSRMHGLFYHPAWATSFQTFRFLPVPCVDVRRVDLCADWYHVVETIYARVKGRPINITRGGLYSHLQKMLAGYCTWEGMFIRHAEVQLIEYLINKRFPPTIIGISKMCCAPCNAWISNMNLHYIRKWRVTGCHGRYYTWARDTNPGAKTASAEDSVKELVYRELVEFIELFIPDGGESPSHQFEDRDDAPQAYHTRLVQSSGKQLKMSR